MLSDVHKYINEPKHTVPWVFPGNSDAGDAMKVHYMISVWFLFGVSWTCNIQVWENNQNSWIFSTGPSLCYMLYCIQWKCLEGYFIKACLTFSLDTYRYFYTIVQTFLRFCILCVFKRCILWYCLKSTHCSSSTSLPSHGSICHC